MSKDRAFESLFLENYSSFFLIIECKEEFTLQGALSGHNEGKIVKKQRENKCLSSFVCSEFHYRGTPISVRLQFHDISLRHASFSMYISQMLF